MLTRIKIKRNDNGQQKGIKMTATQNQKKTYKFLTFVTIWILATAYPAFVQINEWRNEALDKFAVSRVASMPVADDIDVAPKGGAKP